MITARRLMCIVAGFALVGCGTSKPMQFYTLTPVASTQTEATPSMPIQVDAFHIPPVLDRPELVRESGPNGLTINDRERWGAPLGEMARNVLAQDLTKRLPAGAVILPDAPAPPSAAQLVVNVSRFDEGADGRVTLDATWALVHGNPPATLISHDVTLKSTASSNAADAQAAAMSQLLGQLADAIVANLPARSPKG